MPLTPIAGAVAADQDAMMVFAGGSSQVSVGVTGTWVGTLLAEASDDPTFATPRSFAFIEPNLGLRDPFISFNGDFLVNIGALQYFRIRAHPWTSGQAVIILSGIDAAYPFAENYAGTFKVSATRSASGTDSIQLTNYISRAIMLGIHVSAVTGSIGIPTVNAFEVFGANAYQVDSIVPAAANITAPANYTFNWGVASSGGLYTGATPIQLGRNPRLDIVWTLPGATSVTFQCDVFFKL